MAESPDKVSEVEDAVGNDEEPQAPTAAPLADDDDDEEEPGLPEASEGVGADELEAEGKEDE